MDELFALTYVSEASRQLRPEELDAILLDARLFNASEEITGVLFFGDGRFFQLLEGTEQAVMKTFQRLSSAKAHRGVRILSQGPADGRLFDSWHMGFVHATGSAMQALSQAAWEDAIPYTRTDMEKSEGLGLLLYYWNKWSAKPLNSPR